MMKDNIITALIVVYVVFVSAYAITAEHKLEDCEQTLFEHLIKVN